MRTYKTTSSMFINMLLITLSIISFLGCRINEFHYRDRESHLVEKGYERSIAEIDGIFGQGTISVTLEYEFMVGDVLIKQHRDLGSTGGEYMFELYNGTKFEIIYNPKDPTKNIILLNKPVFEDDAQFEKSEGVILLITWRNKRTYLENGFIEVVCNYFVEGKTYLLRASVPKDLFFPNKEYDEITRKDFREVNRKYKGQKCKVEYDINNPGASRLIENSIVSNE